MSDPIACYVVGCPDGLDPASGYLGRCLRARIAATRRPEWGDIIAPPDRDYLCPKKQA